MHARQPEEVQSVGSLSSQTNLPDMLTLSQIVERLRQLRKIKDAIDYRAHCAKFNRLVHGFKHRTRAYVDSLYTSAFAHERDQVDLRRHTDQKTDQRDRTSEPHGGDRLFQISNGVHDVVCSDSMC